MRGARRAREATERGRTTRGETSWQVAKQICHYERSEESSAGFQPARRMTGWKPALLGRDGAGRRRFRPQRVERGGVVAHPGGNRLRDLLAEGGRGHAFRLGIV